MMKCRFNLHLFVCLFVRLFDIRYGQSSPLLAFSLLKPNRKA